MEENWKISATVRLTRPLWFARLLDSSRRDKHDSKHCSSIPGRIHLHSIVGRGFESPRRISGQERGGRATNRGRIRQKSSKIYARLSYYNRCFRGFARCSAFWISDVHWRHALSGRRDSFQLELERRLDREEPSNANSVDFSIVASTQVESVCQVFPTVIFFLLSLPYSTFT